MPQILYETGEFIVCVKPSGVTSEDGAAPGMPSFLCADGQKPFVIHRLDREVGGVMVFAKTRETAAFLSKQLAEGKIGKEYIAVVCGKVPERGEMHDLLFHDRFKNKTYVVKRERAGVKPAELTFERLAETPDGLSLVKIHLKTGRTHQIRVQFASRGTPVAGDRKYGSPVKCDFALFSRSLSFDGTDGARMTFTADPPDTFPWSEFQELH